MKQTPMLYQTPMVQAILRDVDPKTQTRRFAKGTALEWLDVHTSFTPEFVALPSNKLCPYGYAGDLLWVRETFFAWGRWETRFSAKKGRDEWHFVDMTLECGHQYAYAADGHSFAPHQRSAGTTPCWWKRPAIFMPRAASRITLEITGVRVERLQDISEADAMDEGIRQYSTLERIQAGQDRWARHAYRHLWESINGDGSWDANPWVWCLSFKRVPQC